MITTEASSKIAGYTFQFQRALYRLFSSESEATIVGIETDDDVVEISRDANGEVQITFEQDKHSIQDSGQPFQDSSKNLWHTLHIWLDSMKSVREKYNSVRYCLVTNKEVPTRAFAAKLSAASEKNKIEECIKEIKLNAAVVKGKGASSIKAVSEYSDDDLYFLIENLNLMDEFATASGSDPKKATIQLFQLPPDLSEKGDEIYSSILGLLVDTCQTSWLDKKPVWLDKTLFTNRLHSEIPAHRMARFVERPLLSTAYKTFLKNNSNEHLFLKQLQHLGSSIDVCDRALEFYWGFYAERARLQTEGDVLPTAWDERNEMLHQRWQIIGDSAKMEAEPGSSEDVLARKIFAKTIDGNYTAKLGLHETFQPYFTAGNYHDLANQPDHSCFVHWHSIFASEKKEDEEE